VIFGALCICYYCYKNYNLQLRVLLGVVPRLNCSGNVNCLFITYLLLSCRLFSLNSGQYLAKFRTVQRPTSCLHACEVQVLGRTTTSIGRQVPPPQARRDDVPPPMAVRLAADLRPSADRSAVRTWLSCRQPACL